MIGSVCAAPDIVGYRTHSNSWVLGARIDDVSLRGFRPLPGANESCEVYFDSSRVIQFDGKDAEVSVALLFVNERLAGLVIGVPAEEKSFRSLKSYYNGRLAGCEVVDSNRWQRIWTDDDGDFLTLVRTYDADDEPLTLIMYMRESGITGRNRDVPDWLQNLIDSV